MKTEDVSKVELFKHLQLKSLEALSAASDKSQESDSSSVKRGQRRKWMNQKIQFEKDMIRAMRDNIGQDHEMSAETNVDRNNQQMRLSDETQPRHGFTF